ncbi:MAG TPA: HAMP domain-containing sensor histidine kinase [Acidimicrobiales bacterium]|nr:HAMP domain-containing sensor histidine kinase [Acidimicrobiales bacterium]
MTLRARLTLVAAGAVAVVLLVAGIVVYLTVAAGTRGQVDDSLRRLAAGQNGGATLASGTAGPASDGQVVDIAGHVTPLGPDSLTLPDVTRAATVAAGRAPAFFDDVRLSGGHLRIYVARLSPDHAVVLAQPLDRVDDLLRRLRQVLIVVVAGGVAVALAVGWVVARSALAPVRRLRVAAREVATSGDPERVVPVEGNDELADLAASFNEMLVALRRSLAAQRQLVADASHELRTPLTSLRANVDFLRNDPALAGRAAVLDDVGRELEDLSGLVTDLVDLARIESTTDAPSEVRLDEVVAAVVSRTERRWPDVAFTARLAPTVVLALPGQLERALANLLDNAAAWGGPGQPVEVDVAGGEVVVRDHGPGIPPGDLPHVFERFYRAAGARGRPGSGLGLAIVQQAAIASGGSVTAESPADGGTRMRLRLPVVDIRT